jgi:Uma2 family endonuclease
MVASPMTPPSLLTAPTTTQPIGLTDWLTNPPVGSEWVEGALILNRGMTLKHSKIQSRLSSLWRSYQAIHEPAGEVYTEAPCKTQRQGRSPDVAYLTPSLVAQFGNEKVLPQSFPLIAEIVSPTDLAEDMIAKAQEYLESGCEEVWLVFPENSWILILTPDSRTIVGPGQIAATQRVLVGFELAIDALVQ